MARRKKKKRINPAFLLTVLILVVSGIVLFLTPLFHIEDIKISGNERISKAEILIVSGIREDKNIFAINKGYAEKKIKALGYIENVKIKRKLPDTVTIEVKEGKVSAYLDFGGLYAGINKSGQTLCNVSKASPIEGAPVVLGVGVTKADVGSNIVLREGRADEYEVLLKLMNTFDAYNLTDNITEIDVTKKDDIVFRYRGKLKIELGGLNDYDLKFNYLEAMLSELGDEPTGVINMQSENYVYRNTVE